MKLNKILLTASILFGGLYASAQEQITEYVFQPHWYMQGQFGAQETLGEGPFNILAGPNAQLALGYNFNPYVGARLAVNSWRSRATTVVEDTRYKWKWNYVAPTVDVVFNLTNILGGFNPTRVVEVDLLAGLGANIAYKNDGANKVNDLLKKQMELDKSQSLKNYDPLQLIWDGTKTRFVGQFGFDVNFNVSSRLQIGLEMMANVLPDGYNSKKAGNADWYFNGLVGLKYAFGPKYATKVRTIDVAPCEPQIIEKIVEKIVEVPVEVQQEQKKEVEALRRDVFFKINTYNITPAEMTKVTAVADFLKQHPNATVTVTGYADKGTGTKAYNLRLSAQRANTVANTLRTKFGIASSRITVKSMGEDEYQPYPDPVQNRVAICVAE